MKYKKHSFEEKLHCMKLLDQGYPLRQLSREVGIRRNQLYDLRKRYLVYGEDGLRRKPRKYPSDAEMASARLEMMEKKLPLNEICIRHDISESCLRSWKPSEDTPSPVMTRKPKKQQAPDISEIEKLRARNEYLEAENALLKKVKALVEARDARLRETGQKPS